MVDWNGGVQRGGRLTVSASVSASSNQARLQHKLRLITVGAGSACTGGQRGRSMKYHQPVYRDLGKFPCLSPTSNCKIGFPRPPVLAHSGVPRLFLAADLVPVPLTTAQPTLTHHSLPLPLLVVGWWVGRLVADCRHGNCSRHSCSHCLGPANRNYPQTEAKYLSLATLA